jgi:hypothetical protein
VGRLAEMVAYFFRGSAQLKGHRVLGDIRGKGLFLDRMGILSLH